MFDTLHLSNSSKETDYSIMAAQVRAIIDGEHDAVANLANISALLYAGMSELNWLGFYIWKLDREQLVLGPFQGKPACVAINPGAGVCGKAYSHRQTQRVADVHQFPGHIACDSESNSELVVPVLVDGACVALLDIDSPRFNRFSEEDQAGAEAVVRAFADSIDWDSIC